MIRVVIIEDEMPAVTRLKKMLSQQRPDIQITYQAESIREAVNYLQENNSDQLILMDIHLADGLSFEIFKQVRVTAPVIFTTAYDQYAIQAFKVNSIDYLLKPIDKLELKNALEKFDKQNNNHSGNLQEQMLQLLNQMNAEWANCNQPPSSLWSHEWNKHMTCIIKQYPDKYTQTTLFQQVLDLFRETPVADYCTNGVSDCYTCYDLEFTRIPCPP